MQTAQKVESIKRNIDSFSINFVINNDCNYSCKYCPVSLHDGSAPILPVQDYIDFFTRFIENNPLIYTNFKKQDIQLSGGEPTRYEGIEVLCEFFKKNKFRVIMTSNGSAKLEKWDAVLNNVNTLVMSFHPRYCNPHHFLDIVELCRSKKTWPFISLIMDPNYWDRVLEAAELFKQKEVSMQYKGLLPWLGSEVTTTYTPEQKEFLKTNTAYNNNFKVMTTFINEETKEKSVEVFDAQKILANNLNKFKGYSCDIGKNNISIDAFGDVEGATCGMAYFGNIHKDKNLTFKLNESGVICNKESCICISDLLINKRINK